MITGYAMKLKHTFSITFRQIKKPYIISRLTPFRSELGMDSWTSGYKVVQTVKKKKKTTSWASPSPLVVFGLTRAHLVVRWFKSNMFMTKYVKRNRIPRGSKAFQFGQGGILCSFSISRRDRQLSSFGFKKFCVRFSLFINLLSYHLFPFFSYSFQIWAIKRGGP